MEVRGQVVKGAGGISMTPKDQGTGATTLLILSVFFLLIFTLIAWDWWRHGPSSSLDLQIVRHTGKLLAAHPGLSRFIHWSGFLGKSVFLWILALGGAVFLARQKDWPALGLFLVMVVLGNWLVDPLQAWFHRPRPLPELPGARGFGFPSGSAFWAAVVYGGLAWALGRHTASRGLKGVLYLGALLAALLVGLSRLALRLHWLTDVLGAYALAAAWLLLILWFYQSGQGH